MAIRYRVIPFEFDTILFSHVLREIAREDVADFAAAMGISYSLLRAWQNGRYDDTYPHPSMSDFLSVCNQLDLPPTMFFRLHTCEHKMTLGHEWRDNQGAKHLMSICIECGQTVKYLIIEREPRAKGESK